MALCILPQMAAISCMQLTEYCSSAHLVSSILSRCMGRQPCPSQVCIAPPSCFGDPGSRSGLRLLCCKSAHFKSFLLLCRIWDLILD